MHVISTKKNLILSWTGTIETGALNQLVNAAEHPCVDKPVVACPDVHTGYGVPIGCVLPVSAALIPNAVGVDIGCSMTACRTNVLASEVDVDVLKEVVGIIRKNIPTGFNHHNQKQNHKIFENTEKWSTCPVCSQEFEAAQYQLGTMGGGNHFIELQEGDDGFLYYMIHSGSRNLGFKVGNYYNELATNLCHRWRQDRAADDKLAFLPKGCDEYEDYLREMNLCLEFAEANHEVMQQVIEYTLTSHIPNIKFDKKWYTRHNYASIENHNGLNIMIHRKGAILAREGKEQIIPGSQGTASYIVRGLGNNQSYCSASHGAGRVMSRKAAQENLSLRSEKAKMKGIIHNMNTKSRLDEAPSAYKDIDEVLAQESDLVKPIVKLRPLAVIKE